MVDTVVGIEITLIAILYVAFSVFTQRRLVNLKRVNEVQKIIKAKTKELNELGKNKVSNDILMQKQKEISGLLSEAMRSQLKPMFVIMPVFLVLFYLVLPAAFPTNPNINILSTEMNYKTYFIALSFVFGIASSLLFSLRDRLAAKKNANAPEIKQEN